MATGDIDLANVSEFQDAMNAAATDSAALAVDLTSVTYCDSAAVRALFTVAAATKLSLVVPANGPIITVINISGLDRVATVVARA
jgi:anti-anti-sigma factor